MPEPRQRWSPSRFELVRELGEGGFGVVYEARDRERDALVALKTLSALTPRALLRFKREFRALADVAHPNLVAPFELFEEDGVWFFTMPRVVGVDFTAWVRSEAGGMISLGSGAVRPDAITATIEADGTLLSSGGGAEIVARPPRPLASTDRLDEALAQLTEGVMALHRHGLVHRDLKPSNVLVDEEGRVRILDFGLVAAEVAPGDGVVGTPAYMAPEQARGRDVGTAADWYAVGVMTFEALTGTLPFDGPPLKVIVDKQIHDAPAPSTLVPEVPEALDALCVRLLDKEPARRPDGPAILAALRGAPAGVETSLPPSSAEGPLVGRDAELATLGRHLSEAEAGGAPIVLLHGPSGMGKSALIDELRRRTADRAGSLSGRCYEQERVPYLALDEIVDGLLEWLGAHAEELAEPELAEPIGTLAPLFPVLAEVAPAVAEPAGTPHELRRRAGRALRAVLEGMAADRPLLVHLDDVQWGDRDSARLLLEVLRDGAPPGVMFILACRTDGLESSALLAALREGGALEEARLMALGPLDDEAAAQLAARALGRNDPDAIARIVREAGGHAMLLAEAARRGVITGSLDDLLAARLDELEPTPRRLLEVVAVSGGTIPRDDVEAAAGAVGPEPARTLRARRFVRTARAGDRRYLSAYHDRIREVLLDRTPPERRRAHHLALAERLEAVGSTDHELLSRHLHGAAAHARALPHTLAAAESARKALAFDRAVTLLRLALEHTPEGDPARPARMERLADALTAAGRGREAADVYRDAAADVPPDRALVLERRGAEELIRAGALEEGLEALEAVLRRMGVPLYERRFTAGVGMLGEAMRLSLQSDALEPLREESEVDPALLAEIDTLFAAGSPLSLVDGLRGAAFSFRAARLAARAREPRRLVRALVQRSVFAGRKGTAGADEIQGLLARARELAERIGDPESSATVETGEAFRLFYQGRFEEAEREVERIEPTLLRFRDKRWELGVTRRLALKAHTFTGQLGRLRARTDALLDEAVTNGDLYTEVVLRLRTGHFVAMMDDEPERGGAAIDDAMGRWSGRPLFLQRTFEALARAELALYRADDAEASRIMESSWRTIARTQALRSQYMGSECRHTRARAAIAAGEDRVARRAIRGLQRTGAEWSGALALLLRAELEPSVESYAAAAEACDAAGLRLYAVAARARGAEAAGDEEARAGAHGWLSERGVRRPDRFVDLLAPVSSAAA